eukprot:5629613-Pyramimonas_sp.AAC.1
MAPQATEIVCARTSRARVRAKKPLDPPRGAGWGGWGARRWREAPELRRAWVRAHTFSPPHPTTSYG